MSSVRRGRSRSARDARRSVSAAISRPASLVDRDSARCHDARDEAGELCASQRPGELARRRRHRRCAQGQARRSRRARDPRLRQCDAISVRRPLASLPRTTIRPGWWSVRELGARASRALRGMSSVLGSRWSPTIVVATPRFRAGHAEAIEDHRLDGELGKRPGALVATCTIPSRTNGCARIELGRDVSRAWRLASTWCRQLVDGERGRVMAEDAVQPRDSRHAATRRRSRSGSRPPVAEPSSAASARRACPIATPSRIGG